MLFNIRSLNRDDAAVLHYSFKRQGECREERQFLAYFSEQQKGLRKVFIAEHEGEILAYVTLLFKPAFNSDNFNIPQICDLNVFNEFQDQKIATKLVSVCEDESLKVSDKICVALPLVKDFGFVQNFFTKKGYIPDGSGLWCNEKQVEDNNPVLPTDLRIHLVKTLKNFRNLSFYNHF